MEESTQIRKRTLPEDLQKGITQVSDLVNLAVRSGKNFSPDQIQQYYSEGIRSQQQKQSSVIGAVVARKVIQPPKLQPPMREEAVSAAVDLAKRLEDGNRDLESWSRAGRRT